MTTTDSDFLVQVMEAERARVLASLPTPPILIEPQMIHFSELPEAAPGRAAGDWNLYRREVGRLLAEGHEGRWLLITGGEIVGIWDTEAEAENLRAERFLTQDVLVKQIRTREPIVRGGGYDRRWR